MQLAWLARIRAYYGQWSVFRAGCSLRLPVRCADLKRLPPCPPETCRVCADRSAPRAWKHSATAWLRAITAAPCLTTAAKREQSVLFRRSERLDDRGPGGRSGRPTKVKGTERAGTRRFCMRCISGRLPSLSRCPRGPSAQATVTRQPSSRGRRHRALRRATAESSRDRCGRGGIPRASQTQNPEEFK